MESQFRNGERMNVPNKVPFRPHARHAMAAAILLGLAVCVSLPREPVWNGHRLSEWLDAYDTNNRFELGDGRRSTLSDGEIAEAFVGIGDRALPCLRRWLTEKPSSMNQWLNRMLGRQSWIRFRFDEGRDLQYVAVTGFMVYGTDAQSLLPELIALTLNSDPDIRMRAYTAAFFTLPSRETFLPLAHRALRDSEKGTSEMAASWMKTRFPADAEKADLRSKFPQLFEE